jgi:serine O-acetyltransferase
MFDNLREDLKRYGASSHEQMRALLLYPRVWAIASYRFSRWTHTSKLPRPLKKMLTLLVTLLSTLIDITTSIEISPTANIGPGLFIPHTGYIVIGPDVTIGKHCTLTQGITIGHRGGGNIQSYQSPVIGDRVYVGPGAAIVGPITIGDDALVGVGAVVTRSVPSRGVVAGNPAQVLSLKGSFDLISYPGMEKDENRITSLKDRTLKKINTEDTGDTEESRRGSL